MMYLRKNLLIIGLLCTAILLSSTNASAQLSKAERKLWKKELRKLTPEGLKSMLEEKERLSSTLRLLEQQNMQLKSDNYVQEQEIASMEVALHAVREKLKAKEIHFGWAADEDDGAAPGVIFKVQIGALEKEKFTVKKERGYTLEVNNNENFYQYVVGNFRDYHEADLFKKQMRIIGMNKAWIVPYKDGKRVPLKEVLDVVLE